MVRRSPPAAAAGQDPVAAALAAVVGEPPVPGAPPVSGAPRVPAEQALAQWFRQRPGLGRRDRGRIADGVYHLLRHRRLYEALARSRGLADPGEPATLAAMARSIADRTQRAGARQARAERVRVEPVERVRVEPVERAGRVERAEQSTGSGPVLEAAILIAEVEAETGPLPPAERFSLPDWLWSRFVAQYGPGRAAAIAEALLAPAPTDLRVNLIRAKVAAVRSELDRAGLQVAPIDDLPQALRLEGRAPLETLAAFQQGAFERQDAGSQRIVAFAGARRGQTVIDFCAGAGGKTLALASIMRNQGRILAFDPSDARLERLRQRCVRAGVGIATRYRIANERDPGLERFHERGDLVLVDAPCSGTGTLRRDPGLKWALRPEDIEAHAARQRSILSAAAALVAPGGRLVYATCSLLAEENEAVMAAFDRDGGAGRLQWAAPPPSERQTAAAVSCDVEPSDGPVLPIVGSGVYSTPEEAKWTPDRDKSDGFYAAKRAPLVPAHYN